MASNGVALNTRQTAAVTCQVIKDLFKNQEFVNLVEGIVSKAVEKKLMEIMSRVERVESDMFDFQNNLEQKEGEISQLKAHIKNQGHDIVALQNSLNAMEQYSRQTCIRIFGVKEEKGENTDVIAANIITNKLGVPLDPVRDIDRSHRTGKVKEVSQTTSSASSVQQKPRSIIVKLTTYRKRREILLNRKNSKTQV